MFLFIPKTWNEECFIQLNFLKCKTTFHVQGPKYHLIDMQYQNLLAGLH